MKIKPTKICTQEELATVIMVGYSYPLKFIPLEILPMKYCDHENVYICGICTCECGSTQPTKRNYSCILYFKPKPPLPSADVYPQPLYGIGFKSGSKLCQEVHVQ